MNDELELRKKIAQQVRDYKIVQPPDNPIFQAMYNAQLNLQQLLAIHIEKELG